MFSRSFRLLSLLLLMIFVSFVTLSVMAQSGRGQRGTPPPQPTKKPADKPNPYKPTVLNIPEGGAMARSTTDGVTQKFELRNGLRILFRPRYSTGLAAITAYVKAGHFDEADESAGLAWLTGQMLLRSTTSRQASALQSEARRLGAQWQVDVRYESTALNFIAPTESLMKLLELQAEMLLSPAFDAEELKREAQLAILENRRRQDDVMQYTLERMYATAFTTHRLKRPRLNEDFLRNVTREKVQAFYQSLYHPKNVVLVISSDLLATQVIGRMQQLFGNWQFSASAQPEKQTGRRGGATPSSARSGSDGVTRQRDDSAASNQQPTTPNSEPRTPDSAPATPNSSPATLEEAEQKALRYANERGDLSQSIVTVGFHVAPLSGAEAALKEQAAIEVMSAALALGRAARLTQALRERQSLATDVRSECVWLPGAGLVRFQMRIEPERIDKAEAELFREIERLRRELLGEAELQRVKTMLEKRQQTLGLSMNDEAGEVAFAEMFYGSTGVTLTWLERIRAVTPQEVQQAAAKYLTLYNATVFEYEARTATPRSFTPEKFAELAYVFAPSLTQSPKTEEIKPATALKKFFQGEERVGRSDENIIVAEVPLPIKDFSVYRGPRAYVREDHSQRRLTLGIFFQGGRLIEDASSSGTTEMMLRCMLRSTSSRKSDLIAHELESYGAEIQIVNESDLFGFTLDVLSRNAEAAIRVLLDIVENPFFEKNDLAREREALLAAQLWQRDDTMARTRELLLNSIYPAHAYGLPRYGLPAVIKALSEEKLENWHARTVKRQFPLVIFVGDTDGSALVSKIFTDGLKRSTLDQTIKAGIPGVVTPQPQTENRARKLTALAAGFRTPEGKSADGYALEIIRQLAASTGGRLTAELRDQQTIAGIVRVENITRLISGALLVYADTLPENEQRTQEALRAALEKLIATAPDDEEFEGARNTAISEYALALQSHNVRAVEYARAVINGRKVTEVEAHPEMIRAVKKEDIRRVAESVIKPAQAGRGILRAETVPEKK
jgi:zinc protease